MKNPSDVLFFDIIAFGQKFIVQGIDVNVCLRYNGAVIIEALSEER